MTLNELENIVRKGESQFVEFKHKLNFPEKIAREVVAFANTNNGKLIIGVEDNKTIFGLKNVKEEIFAFEKVIKNYVKFPVQYQLNSIKINDKKEVLVVEIFESIQKPNYAFEKPNEKNGLAFVRQGDKSIKASDLIIEVLKNISIKNSSVVPFGEVQRTIIQFLDKNPQSSFQKIISELLISEKELKKSIIQLAVLNLIDVLPHETFGEIISIRL